MVLGRRATAPSAALGDPRARRLAARAAVAVAVRDDRRSRLGRRSSTRSSGPPGCPGPRDRRVGVVVGSAWSSGRSIVGSFSGRNGSSGGGVLRSGYALAVCVLLRLLHVLHLLRHAVASPGLASPGVRPAAARGRLPYRARAGAFRGGARRSVPRAGSPYGGRPGAVRPALCHRAAALRLRGAPAGPVSAGAGHAVRRGQRERQEQRAARLRGAGPAGGGAPLGEVFADPAACVPQRARPDAQRRRGFRIGCTADGPGGPVLLDVAVQAEPELRIVGERLSAAGVVLLETALRDPGRRTVQAAWHTGGSAPVTRAPCPTTGSAPHCCRCAWPARPTDSGRCSPPRNR